MMRKLFVFAMVAGLLGMGGFVRDARAGATVDVLFVGINGVPLAGTDTVTASAGDVLTMVAIMTNDQALTAAFFSLNYDLDGDNELDVVSAFNWGGVALIKSGTDFFAPFVALFPPTSTVVGSFNGFVTNVALPRTLPPAGASFAGGYQMGTVTWSVNPGVGAGSTEILSFLAPPDGFGDAGFNPIDNLILFRTATVNFIPEPGTASLLGLGLVGLVLMGRRSRS